MRLHQPSEVQDELTRMLRSGVRRLLEEALAGEVQEFLRSLASRRDVSGRAAVVRNGY